MPEQGRDDMPEDLQDLARRYVDLWQDQMTALASDPDFAESLQKVLTSMGVAASGLPALWTAWPAAMSSMMAAVQPDLQAAARAAAGTAGERENAGKRENDGSSAGKHKADSQAGAAAGAPASAAAPHGGGTDLGVLEERLAALEQRLLALEGKGRRTGSRAKGKSKGD